MRITGSVEFQTSPQAVWEQLVKPQALSQCTPGLATWEMVEPDKTFRVLLYWMLDRKNRIQIPMTIVWERLEPPQHMALRVEALAGDQPILATGTLTLTPQAPADTVLAFAVEITPANKMIAQLITGLAPRFIDGFFKCFKARVHTENDMRVGRHEE